MLIPVSVLAVTAPFELKDNVSLIPNIIVVEPATIRDTCKLLI